jgi:hypothetical protein
MAQPYDSPQPGDPTANISSEKARQGQNIKGMIWVLIISLVLVVGAFAVMLALQSEPVSIDGRATDDPAAITSTAPAGADTSTPETAQSPT